MIQRVTTSTFHQGSTTDSAHWRKHCCRHCTIAGRLYNFKRRACWHRHSSTLAHASRFHYSAVVAINVEDSACLRAFQLAELGCLVSGATVDQLSGTFLAYTLSRTLLRDYTAYLRHPGWMFVDERSFSHMSAEPVQSLPGDARIHHTRRGCKLMVKV